MSQGNSSGGKTFVWALALIGLACLAGFLAVWSGVITSKTPIDAKRKAVDDFKTEMEFQTMEAMKAAAKAPRDPIQLKQPEQDVAESIRRSVNKVTQ